MFEPTRLEDVVPRRLAYRLYELVRGRHAVLVYGPPGSGKTTAVRVVSRMLGLRYVVFDPAEASSPKLARAVMSGAKILVHILGVDELGEREVSQLTRVLRNTRVPVVLEANNGWCPAAMRLRRILGGKLVALEYRYPSKSELVSALYRVCRILGVRCDDAAVQLIAARSKGNIEAAVSDLYAVATLYGEVDVDHVNEYYEDIVEPRDVSTNIWRALQRFFDAEDYWSARRGLDEILEFIDLNQAFTWILESIPVFMSGTGEKRRAYRLLLLARETLDHTLQTKQWSLYAYVFDYLASIPLVMESKKRQKRRLHAPRRIESYIRFTNTIKNIVAEAKKKHPILSSREIKSFITETVYALHRGGKTKNEIIEKIVELGFNARNVHQVVENLLPANAS